MQQIDPQTLQNLLNKAYTAFRDDCQSIAQKSMSECQKASETHNILFQQLKNHLNPNENELLIELDDANNQRCTLETELAYELGFQTCLYFLKHFGINFCDISCPYQQSRSSQSKRVF